MAEYFSWTNISWQEKIDLTTLYGPYLALCKSFVPIFDSLLVFNLRFCGLVFEKSLGSLGICSISPLRKENE